MFWEILRNFPKGFQRIVQDVKLFMLIQDAAKYPRNVWTNKLNQSDHLPAPHLSIFHIYSQVLPRQQQEFQRRLKRDLRKVFLPIVGYALLPIVGNIFILLPALVPTRFASRHFLEPHSLHLLAYKQYQQRKQWYDAVAHDFWNSGIIDELYAFRNANRMNQRNLNFFPLLNILLPQSIDNSSTNKFHPLLHRSFLSLTSSQLYHLCRAHGSSVLARFAPNAYLRKRLLNIAKDIFQDDFILLRENHHFSQCSMLSEEEVLDSCLLRGLSIENSGVVEMRQHLTHHLYTVEPLIQRLEDLVKSNTHFDHKCEQMCQETVYILILYLPALRLL